MIGGKHVRQMLAAGALVVCASVVVWAAPGSAPAQGGGAQKSAPPKAGPAGSSGAGQAGAAGAKVDAEAGRKAFLDVARVLQSPRCRNCHPAGNAPLHGDHGMPHTMNITRRSPEVGLPCTTCHRERNARVKGAPPGVPNWHMPPAEMPMVFEGKSPHELCVQLKDPAQNGGKDLQALAEHMSSDKLVLWGWNPGEGRTLPPLPFEVFVSRVEAWVQAGGPCPAPEAAPGAK